MKKMESFRVLALATLLALFPRPAPAPIYGFFPGLEKLIEQSSDIIVAEILPNEDNPEGAYSAISFGMHEDRWLRVLCVIKGDLPVGERRQVALRDLGFNKACYRFVKVSDDGITPVFESYGQRGYAFPAGSRHLLFLQDGAAFFTGDDGQQPGHQATLYNVNCEGSHFELRADTPANFLVEGKPPRAAIEALVKETLARLDRVAEVAQAEASASDWELPKHAPEPQQRAAEAREAQEQAHCAWEEALLLLGEEAFRDDAGSLHPSAAAARERISSRK
jgi:hypothetical protein